MICHKGHNGRVEGCMGFHFALPGQEIGLRFRERSVHVEEGQFLMKEILSAIDVLHLIDEEVAVNEHVLGLIKSDAHELWKETVRRGQNPVYDARPHRQREADDVLKFCGCWFLRVMASQTML